MAEPKTSPTQQVIDIVISYKEGPDNRLTTGPYFLYMGIDEWLHSQGYAIVVGERTDIAETPCQHELPHQWDGRRICGITFRKCVGCGLMQRKLYSPWFEDFDYVITKEQWLAQPEADHHDDPVGTKVGWR